VRNPASYGALASEQDIRLTDDFGAVVRDPAVDAVVIATPPWLHAGQIEAAAGACKHVFVEKPITLNSREAEAARAACERAGVTLAVGFNRRFLPAIGDMHARIGADQIGTLLHMECQFSGATALRTPPGIWRMTRDANPAGGMVARGMHSLDLMISFLGTVRTVYAMSDRRETVNEMDDTTSVLLRFAGGGTGYLSTIMATGEYWRVQALGSKGWIEMRGKDELLVSDLDKVVATRSFEKADIECAELEAFADAITGSTRFPVPPDDSVHGIAVLEAISKSADTNEVVKVGDPRLTA
ncbi:MAG: Gfo/Idh/MocA family oxidoreductase, partial [Proteobacteria bacterium]|nr:Gfo/Idh/MocA family oxidoreductase [Pseudomonadota bacterium]